MTELIDRQAVLEIAMSYCPDDDGCCSKAGHDLREMLDEIEALPTIDPETRDIDRAAILRLCNEIEMIIVTVCDTGYTLQEGDEEAIMKRTRAIRKELTGDVGSKTD